MAPNRRNLVDIDAQAKVIADAMEIVFTLHRTMLSLDSWDEADIEKAIRLAAWIAWRDNGRNQS